MNVILDTNIFRSDITLRSKEFTILLDYLSKTESKLMIPQIILDEIKGLFKRTLIERITELKKNINNINLILTDNNSHINVKDYDVDFETSEYENFLINKLKINKNNIIPYNNEFLPEISMRAINRQKPSGDKGQGFRDTMIWLTIKEHCKKSYEKQISFISNNTDDFGNSDKNNLHESLIDECEKEKIKINYFKSIKEFIETHSVKIEFINDKWIKDNLDYTSVEDIILNELNKNDDRNVYSWFKNETDLFCEGYKALSVNILENDTPTVYEMADNSLIINLTVYSEIEIEFYYYHYEYNFNDDYPDYEKKLKSIVEYIVTNVSLSLTLEENRITDIEVNDII